MLENTPNQQTKFRTKNQVEINDDSRGTYNTISQTKFKTSVLRTSWCDYSNAYILVSGTITITGAGNDDAARRLDERDKWLIFKYCAPFTDCISEINSTQIHNAKYVDVMPMYNLIEYSDKCSETFGILWQYHRDDPNDPIIESESFKYKIKITGKSPVTGNTKNVQIAVPLKYLSNFWRTLEMWLINCEINLFLTWCQDCVNSSATGQTKFKITGTKLYAPVVTLSIQDNEKLLHQLKSGFKRTFNWNKYQTKVSDFLIDPRFQGAKRLFIFSFENDKILSSKKRNKRL